MTQPSSFSNSVSGVGTTVSPRWRSSSAVRGALADITTEPPPRSTTAVPSASGTARSSPKQSGSSTFGGIADHRAIGQRGHRGLEMQNAVDRHADHRPALWSDQRPQLIKTGSVGAGAQTDVRGALYLEHVTAVEVSRRLDQGDRSIKTGQRPCGRGDLTDSRRCAWAGQHREVVEDHRRVLDEDPVRVGVQRLELDDRPAVVGEDRDIGPPLVEGQLRVDVDPGQVGELAGGQPRRRRPDQELRSACAAHGHSSPLGPRSLHSRDLIVARCRRPPDAGPR